MVNFPDPPAIPGDMLTRLYAHAHDWAWIGAGRHPNGTWSPIYACSSCPDVAMDVMQHIGPIPPGYCRCGWVNKDPAAKRCDECGEPLDPAVWADA